MVSLNFTTGKGKILDGSKEMTIRALRKRPIKVGDKLHLFSGLRTKNCQRLKETICLYEKIVKWGNLKVLEKRKKLARLDGFLDWIYMELWFIDTHQPLILDKEFQIICWGEETKGKLERMFSD